LRHHFTGSTPFGLAVSETLQELLRLY